MALSDCVECLATPCRCGHEYQGWDESALEEQIQMLTQVLQRKQRKAASLKAGEEMDRFETRKLIVKRAMLYVGEELKVIEFDNGPRYSVFKHRLNCGVSGMFQFDLDGNFRAGAGQLEFVFGIEVRHGDTADDWTYVIRAETINPYAADGRDPSIHIEFEIVDKVVYLPADALMESV